jgi:hypothetical protein
MTDSRASQRGVVTGPLREIKYDYAGETLRLFHNSSAFVRGIMGPFGSGKSSACAMEILWRAGEQAPGPDGVRRSRWAIIRQTYPELALTTLKTFRDWTGGAGQWKQNPPITYHLQAADIDLEVIALALADEADVKKLLSLELTGCWLNEVREVPKAILDAVTGRVGRYPSQAQGGPSWAGVIMDTNPMADDHWYYRLAEIDTPPLFEFFRQPSGLSPEAENKSNLPAGYYQNISAGKDPEWVNVYVHGNYGHLIEGKPVYANFRDGTHVATATLSPLPDTPLLIGVDFGLTPAAVVAQRAADGRWLILSELVTEETGVIRFAQALAAHVAREYSGNRVAGVFTDPAGSQRSQVDERTAVDILAEHTGWKVRPAAPTNDWTMRLEVVLAGFGRLVDGRPGVLISPACASLRKACNGGYHFKTLRTSVNGLGYDDTPAKNFSSHVAEALQYLMLGGGDAALVMNRVKRRDPRQRRLTARGLDYDVLNLRDAQRGRPREKVDPIAWPAGIASQH